jgi:predicted acetyltransferase
VTAKYTEESLPVPSEALTSGEVTLRFVRMVPGDPSRDFVPYYHFRIVAADGSDVGHINFRVGDTEHVRFFAGHIGFQILEPFRGHRHALHACHAIAPLVRTLYETVIITCDPDNVASMRTIERLGASFIDEVTAPSHGAPDARVSWRKRRYSWSP